MSARTPETRLLGPIGVSALLHASAIAAVAWTFRAGPPLVLPPVYKVNIIAAPPGPRAIGEVKSGPAPTTPAEAPPKTREVVPTAPVAPPTKAPAAAKPSKATPTNSTAKPKANTDAPKAGGGPKGGRGSDVATVQTGGVDFPFPGYLNNIVRQIALNFHPSDPNSPLRAEVAFLIRRDGSVSNVRFITRSGVYAFDLEAKGAVERAAKAFGPLPDGFGDDVLPVVFSFSPEFLR